MPYIIPYILGLPAYFEIPILSAFLVGMLAGAKLWGKTIKKISHKNSLILGFIWVISTLIPIIFLTNYYYLVFFIGILGFGIGAICYGNHLIFTNFISELDAADNKQQERRLLRIRTLILKSSIIIQAICFWAIHIMTGFDPALESQSNLAIWGLRLQFTLIPLIFLLSAAIVFYYFYDLTPEKS